MKNALGSKTDLNMKDNHLAKEYLECIQDLYNEETIQQLDSFTQHMNTSRLQHSINVSYYSYLLCKKLKLDYRSAARAGLLHDLFLYDWREEKQPEGSHAVAHPQIALRNARKIANLNEIEEDAIVKHMWPLTLEPPKHAESYVVSFVDKYCAVFEISHYMSGSFSSLWCMLRSISYGGVYAR